jgi:hypothetical protein
MFIFKWVFLDSKRNEDYIGILYNKILVDVLEDNFYIFQKFFD